MEAGECGLTRVTCFAARLSRVGHGGRAAVEFVVCFGGGGFFRFFFFKQKTAYEIMPSLVGSEMCIRDSSQSVKTTNVTQTDRQID